MPIRSELHRGRIYAGDTPLACSITVEQTGPMQLTVRAGSFTTTGHALIRDYDPTLHDPLLAAGKAEKLPDLKRLRIWIQNASGTPIEQAATYVLAADQIVDLTSDPVFPVAYALDLMSDGVAMQVLVKRRIVGIGEYGGQPPGWRTVHALAFEFMLPPGTTDISGVEIFALTVHPGFPPGTGPADWTIQMGRAAL